MPVATLSIDLEARLAKLEQGLSQAVGLAERNSKRMQDAFDKVGQSIKGLGIAAAVTFTLRAAFDQLRGSIDQLDRIDDLSEKFGINAGALSEWAFASEVAGTNTEDLAAGLQKLSKAATAAAGGSKEQSAAFKAIGVSVRDATGNLKSADALLLEIADKFAGYEDGIEKAALAQEFFGKSGASMIPLLNKGSAGIKGLRDEARQLGAAFSDEAAKAAGDFNDQVKKLELSLKGVAISLANEILPTLRRFVDELLEGRKAFGSFTGALIGIGLKGSGFKSYGEGAAAAREEIQRLDIAIKQIEDRTPKVAETGGGAGMVGPRQRAGTGAKAALEAQREEQRAALAYYTARQQTEALLNGDAYGDSRSGVRAPSALPKKPAPIVGATGGVDKIQQELDAYNKLIEKIKERGAAEDYELEQGRKMSEADAFLAQIQNELASATSKLTPAHKAEAEQLAKSTAAKIRESSARAESLRLFNAENQAQAETGKGRAQELADLKEQVDAFGKSAEKLNELAIARLRNVEAKESDIIATARAYGATDAELAQLEENLRLLREIISTREKDAAQRKKIAPGDVIGAAKKSLEEWQKEAADLASGTERLVGSSLDGLVSNIATVLSGSKADWKSYFQSIISEALTLAVIKPFISNLLSGITGSGGGNGSWVQLVMGLFGSANGNAFSPGGVVPFANGGLFSSPTLFQFAKGGAMSLGVMGEAGPEAVMPLKRGRDGRLGVAAEGGGGGNYVFNVAAGVQKSEMMAALRQVQQQMMAYTDMRMKSMGAK